MLFRSNGSTFDTVGSYPHRFYTGGTERMRIDSSGNVGIGTTSPSLKLSINGGVRTVSNSYMLGQGFGIYGNNDSANYIIQGDATSGGTLIYNWYGGHIFQTNGGNERMRIDSSGNLGVGTTTTGRRFNIGIADTTAYNSASMEASPVCTYMRNTDTTVGSYVGLQFAVEIGRAHV